MHNAGMSTGNPGPGQRPPEAGEEWLTSLWQQVYTVDSSSMLQGAATVTSFEQPALWHFVRTVAREVGSDAPEQIRVVGNAHVATHEDPFSLDIGVPLLLALDQGDLAEIVGRALTDRLTSRGETVAAPTRARPSRLGRLSRLLGGPGAGESAGAHSGTAGNHSRLEEGITLATQWWIDEFVLPDLTDNLVPRPVYMGLVELLMERGGEIADYAELGERPFDPKRPQDAEPAMFLLVNEDALLEAVADAGLPPATSDLHWDDAMTRWAHRRARAASLILFRSATPEVRTLTGLLDIIERGDFSKRVSSALRSKGGVRDECVFLLTGVLADAFAESGAGDLTCSWGGVIDLISAKEGALDLTGVARQVVDDTSVVPFLREILLDYKVSPNWSPSDTATEDDRALQSFLNATGQRQAPGTGFLHGGNAS